MEQRLRQVLHQRQKRRILAPGRVPAAVLVPIYRKEGRYHLLFTMRTEAVREHKGQVAFPGGAYQEGDKTLLDTALRECAEEIGLAAADVEVLGELDDIVTETSNYVVTPFVGIIPWPYHFTLSPEEAEELIKVPVSALMDGGSVWQETRTVDGKAAVSYFYRYRRWLIWGATAGILRQLLDILAAVMDGGPDGKPEGTEAERPL